jgi:hypothetical protein
VRTAKLELQRLKRLKPDLFCRVYVVAKATTHNDSAVLTQTLKPQAKGGTYVVAEATTHKSCDFFRNL